MILPLISDNQEMLISLERIDVDYRRCDDEISKKIADFIYNALPLLAPRVLEVFVRDIETEREHYFNMGTVHGTIDNWDKVEKECVKLLKSEYNIDSTLRGLYTEFSWSPEGLTYKYDKEIEINDEDFSKLLKGAFIYALPRHTYVVGDTIAFIKAHKDKLHDDDKSYILKRIIDRCERFKNEDENNSFHAFDSHDVEQWKKLKEDLE